MNQSKRGVFGISLGTLISLIITIAILTVGISIAVTVWQDRNTATESLRELVETIESLEDGKDAKSFVYQLPDEFALINFKGGQNFDGQSGSVWTDYSSPCAEIVFIPDACGDANCLAICDGSWKTSWEEACTDDLQAYQIIPSDWSFKDTSCGDGLYREGSGNGVMTLYLQKNGNIISVCNTKECLFEGEDEIEKKFESLVTTYKSCQSDSKDCACTLDIDFLTDKHAIKIKDNNIDLTKIKGNLLASQNFETKVSQSTSISLASTGEYILYQGEVTEYSADTIGGSSTKTVTPHLLLSTNQDNVANTNLLSISKNQATISKTIYKINGEMTLVENGYNFDNVRICGEEEPQVVASL